MTAAREIPRLVGIEVHFERVIPKAAFRKRLAVFYFDADPADSVARWLGYGMAAALTTDLFQDMFIDQRVPLQFRDRLREAGFRDLTGVPLTLKREIATVAPTMATK